MRARMLAEACGDRRGGRHAALFAHHLEGVRDLATQLLVARLEERPGGVVVGHGLGREHDERLHDAGTLRVEDRGAHEVPEQRHAVGDVLLFEIGDVRLVAVAEHLQEQLILRSEVVEDAGVGHPDLIGDLDEGAVGVAFTPEDLDRRVEDLAPSSEGFRPRTRLPTQSRHGRHPPFPC